MRDCTSVLATLAERWVDAEQYRDCFEILARAISVSQRETLGMIGREAREEIHRHVSTMLWEMAELGEEEGMET
jgi:hypothetical protein